MDARYIPKVLDFTEHLSTDAQGLPQVKDILFTDGNPANTPVQPSASNPATFLDLTCLTLFQDKHSCDLWWQGSWDLWLDPLQDV